MKDWENKMIMEGKVQLISNGTRNKIGSSLKRFMNSSVNLKVKKIKIKKQKNGLL